MKQKQETVFEDYSIISFCSLPEIQKKYELIITPFKQSNGRVAFRVIGDIESAVAEIYANKKVGISDFMKALRSVRSTIFTLRNLGNVEGDRK